MDGEFKVAWKYSLEGIEYTREETHSIVSPLFLKEDLVAYDQQFLALSDSKIVELERLIREVIQSHTGQVFGTRLGTVSVYGTGDNVLISPERIISLTPSSTFSAQYQYRVVNDGFGIEKTAGFNAPGNIKVPAEEEQMHYGQRTWGFPNNVRYQVTGVFGWLSVPQEIKDAALILAQMFSCDETLWRDRYIKSVRAADWQFDFGAEAFTGTGSVSADRLLSKFILNRIVIV